MFVMPLSQCCWGSLLFASLTLLCFFGWRTNSQGSTFAIFGGGKNLYDGQKRSGNNLAGEGGAAVMTTLLQAGVYNEHDFENEMGIVPPYWSSQTHRSPMETTTAEWGPCFGTHQKVHWDKEIEKYKLRKKNPIYPGASPASSAAIAEKEKRDWANFCRPGFLIIGAGKCGTSSLYHYITDHPRVLPASEKQIHYFKYFADRSMKWYLHHFPTATSFLASGALITGEASPGYLPYPDIAQMVRDRLPTGPRIVVIGREPVDRAYSSYRYNYVVPTIKAMRGGRISGVPHGQVDTYYERYLFSFEEMIQAELGILRDCLAAPNGSAVAGARKIWGSQSWAKSEYGRREKLGLDPLVDLDGFCYGDQVNGKVLRKQWSDLMEMYPTKVIADKNVHLTQALIGRGLYTFPLEWWFAVFEKSDIYFICTEELTDMTGEPINKLGQFLGLPSYNFSETVNRGAFNVGNHQGYDTEVSWSELEEERLSNATDDNAMEQEIPLSDDIRRELEDFFRPYNERLFNLVGRRCDW